MKTDLELQLALAKMLPNTLYIFPTRYVPRFDSVQSNVIWWILDNREVLDTEWLHACWLIESGMNDEQYMQYTERMFHNSLIERHHMSASWQQRASALIAVKGEK